MFNPSAGKRIPLVLLEGTIRSGSRAGSLCYTKVSPILEKAFTKFEGDEVCLLINSPGGSPAQSSLIYKTIVALKKQHKKKVVGFVSDMAASGGMYIACAADELIVDENSALGSVGVISQWFGVTEMMQKIGVRPRIYTAGKNKAFLSPFQEEPSEKELARLREIQTQIHESFKQVVQASRGSKLKEGVDHFSGDIWFGEDAVRVGLADKIGDPSSWIAEREGRKFQVLKEHSGFFSRFMPSAETLAKAVLQVAENQSKYTIKM